MAAASPTKDHSSSLFFEKAKRFCVYKERSTYAMHAKLKAWGAADDTAHKVVNRLVEEKFIDNSRYLNAYIRGKFGIKKWGKRKISFMLKSEGFSYEEFAPFLSAIDDEYESVLIKLIQNKMNQNKSAGNSTKLKQKVIRYCMQKGYDYQIIDKVLNQNSFFNDTE